MSRLGNTATVAMVRNIHAMSGIPTSFIMRRNGDIDIWHGGKKKRFNTSKAAQTYLQGPYDAYKKIK